MKRKDKDELLAMKAAELRRKASELTKQMNEARLNMITKEVKNRRVVAELRKKRAVTLSILRAKELA